MTSSYLATRLVLPLAPAALEASLDEPVGRCSPQLRAILDDALRTLREPADDALQHHDDVAWLDAHVDRLASLTGWELLLLFDGQSRPADREERSGAWGCERRGHRIPCLGFAYADAALAERLAGRLPAGRGALFELVPTGDKDRVDLLLDEGAPRRLASGYPGQWHPLRRWLDALPPAGGDASSWPAFDARRAAELGCGSLLLVAWRAFMAQQRQAAVAQASVSAPFRLGPHHVTDGRHVDWRAYRESEPVRLEHADPASFRVVEDHEGAAIYGVDAHRLWHGGDRLPSDDAPAFAPLAVDPRFMTDGCHVYHDHEWLEGIDARRARAVPGSDWPNGFLHDDVFVVAYGGARLHDVDGSTFRALAGSYVADRDGVYERHEGELIRQDGFDAATIRIVDHGEHTYLVDATHVALARGNGLAPRPLKRASAAAFHGVPMQPLVTDGERFWRGAQVVKDVDAETLAAAPVAEPAPLDVAAPDDGADDYRFLGAVVEGWHPATHRIGAFGAVESEGCLYTLQSIEGGSILAWTKAYSDYPLLHYELDDAAGRWRPAGPLPTAQQLQRMPTGPMLTPAEFEALFECLPAGDAFACIESRFDEPAVTATRWRDSRILNLRGALRYNVNALGGPLEESIAPARTPGLCAAIRAVLEQLLAAAPTTRSELLRQAPQNGDAAADAVASHWCRQTLPGLVGLLAPRLQKEDARQLLAAVRAAAASAREGVDGSEDGGDASERAWESLLDSLESLGLLVTLDKQELRQAVALCNDLAAAAGLAGPYELGDESPGRSVVDVAADFGRWLEPAGHGLLSPQGSWRSSGDDHFPVVIVRSGAVVEVAEAARSLGGHRGFGVVGPDG